MWWHWWQVTEWMRMRRWGGGKWLGWSLAGDWLGPGALHSHHSHSWWTLITGPACSIYISMYPPCALWTHTVSLQICPTLPPATAPIISSPDSSKILLFTPWFNFSIWISTTWGPRCVVCRFSRLSVWKILDKNSWVDVWMPLPVTTYLYPQLYFWISIHSTRHFDLVWVWHTWSGKILA